MTVLGINGNASFLAATYQVQQTAARLQNTMTQMSTGYRINSAADDPAGLIASELMRSDITAANKAIANTQRANGVLSIAESGMQQISALLNEAKALAVESANTGAMSPAMIAANQQQVDAILASVDRISQSTQFLGKPLLDGSLGAEQGGAVFQIGTNVTSSGQATINLESVNSHNIGGEGGSFADLASGGIASLATNPALADKILTSAIGDIASRRGELGTTQRVTFDTNIASLQDYVVAVAGAEASIRDTDYATATSKAARDQILLQTGLRALSMTQRQQLSVVNTLLADL